MTAKEMFRQIFLSRAFRRMYWTAGILAFSLFIVDSFVMPWYVNRGGTLTVPNVVGMKEEEAFKLLESKNLQPKKGEVRPDNRYPVGHVVLQNPAADQIVKSERRVYLTISGGELSVIVPSLRGRTLRDSKFMLDKAGLRQGAIAYQTSTELPEGTIISQDIPGGNKARRGSYIGIVVSAGESIDSIFVPSLVGMTLMEAQKSLKEKGLKLGNITYQMNSELLPNTVIDQLPRENEIVTTKKEVDLFIAQAPEKGAKVREN